MKIDLTITVSVILALASILSNVIVTVLNNKHQAKIKQLEMYELQKRDALQNFINTTIDCYKSANNWRENKEFSKNLYILQLYFKSANIKFIEALNALINDTSNKDNFELQFAKVISKLSEEIQKH